MKVIMNLEQAKHHVELTEPLQLREIRFKINPEIHEKKKLFRGSTYYITIFSEVNNQVYEFLGEELDQEVISQLEKNPSKFLVGSEPPFLCGAEWSDSAIGDVIARNDVASNSLILTDGKQVIATIYVDEVPQLINWFKKFK